MNLLSVDDAVKILKQGGVVAVPTETVYGLAAIADNKAAITRIFDIKNRPADNPLICHFHSFDEVRIHVLPYPEYVDELVEALTPGPVSFMLKLKKNSPLSIATLGREDIIVRIPAHPLLLELLRKLNKPLAAPSANTSGKYSPTNVAMIDADLGNKIDGIIDGGESATGIESTIIDCRSEGFISILRPGAIGKTDVENILDDQYWKVKVDESKTPLTTPGAKYRHYAPRTPLSLINDTRGIDTDKNFVLLASEEAIAEAKSAIHKAWKVICIGSEVEPETIAHNLYRVMFEMDAMNADLAYIIIPIIKEATWRTAIMNRIGKMIGG